MFGLSLWEQVAELRKFRTSVWDYILEIIKKEREIMTALADLRAAFEGIKGDIARFKIDIADLRNVNLAQASKVAELESALVTADANLNQLTADAKALDAENPAPEVPTDTGASTGEINN